MHKLPSTAPKADILIIDDMPDNLRVLSGMLTQRGYKVRSAPDGALAIQAAHSTPPDLILLDIVMPDLDGYAVCQQLKADPRTSAIPVIFLSVLAEPMDKIRAFSVGGVDYVTKPFQAEEVLARVETHLTLRRLQRNLEEQIAELDAFAQTVAHDLRTPLTVVVGYAEHLSEAAASLQDKSIREGMRQIAKAGTKMSNIIDELLLLAGVRKMERVALTPLDMAAIVAEAQGRLSTIAAECQAEIVLPRTWPSALGYAPWVEAVWANYINNAIKYGGEPSRGIPPHVELGADFLPHARHDEQAGGRGAMIRFWVSDNGCGLDPEQQSRLFAEFTQLHQVRAQGHGLGLSIVRRIVERLGGQVGVESAAGQGSRFYFTLPAAPG